jgi:hypothetical protein
MITLNISYKFSILSKKIALILGIIILNSALSLRHFDALANPL